MHREHAEHAALIDRVLELCATLAERPERHGEVSAPLGIAARALRQDLERHLVTEEEGIFPAIRRLLDEDDRARIVEELRARRAAGHSSR